MRKLLFVGGLVLAAATSPTHPARADPCSVSDLSLTIGGTAYTPYSCVTGLNPPRATIDSETTALNNAFGTGYTALAKDDGASETVNGIQFNVTNTSNTTAGTWSLQWTDTNGSALDNLPVSLNLEVGLFGGSTGAGYLFQNVLLMPPPDNSGTGDFTISFDNKGGQNPDISTLTVAGGPMTEVVAAPEPMSLAVTGVGLIGLGLIRRRRVETAA